MHYGKKQGFSLEITSHYHLELTRDSGSYSGASCLSLPRTDAVTSVGGGTKHWYRQMGGCYFSTICQIVTQTLLYCVVLETEIHPLLMLLFLKETDMTDCDHDWLMPLFAE